MANVVVQQQMLRSLVAEKLEQVGVPAGDAATVADVLVHADLRGVHSHGVLRTEHYVRRVCEGGLNIHPDIAFQNTGPVTGVLDGDDGFGHVIAKQAMRHAIELAKNNGLGAVGVINSSHCGALSYFVNQAVEENLIGMAMTHTDTNVVPFGGARPFFGTNPLAFGFPAGRNKPIILDMATSEVAFGKVLAARDEGKQIPATWGVDQVGDPSTDPFQLVSLLPFGGAKGYGLALVVEVLSGLLTGSAFGPHIVPMYGDYDKMRKLGHFFCAVNPAFFTKEESFLQAMDQMIEEIHQVPPARGVDRVLVPGEPEQQNEERYGARGVPIAESVYQYLMS
ncbi:ureidoglycolate dehydrogenase [Alicyclobacillus fastidiosus]|uniref:Ureidoglycolate dehydrogenase n=1 Tax=Alicyclobacillus fastidiosus TaxID=392011 RepID=A0ABV5AI47_9BACL|nr:ureidoglycolate dehydrogenase [Alicyclobacillus fastidiosus]WEH10137.1 ureidoglycolate dehydrogenase [Alicyclobacillus fastidiosus]